MALTYGSGAPAPVTPTTRNPRRPPKWFDQYDPEQYGLGDGGHVGFSGGAGGEGGRMPLPTDPNGGTGGSIAGPGLPVAPSEIPGFDPVGGLGGLDYLNSLGFGGSGSGPVDFSLSPGLQFDDEGLGALIRGGIESIVGGQTRYSPEVVESMKADLLKASKGQLRGTERAIKEDAVGRGVYRSGIPQRNLAEARNAQAQDYTGGVADILHKKASADFEDKLAGMDRAQKYLDQARSFFLANEANLIDRDKIRANIALAQQKLDQDWRGLQAQIASQRDNLLLSLQPREGTDYTYVTGPDGQRIPQWYRDLLLTAGWL